MSAKNSFSIECCKMLFKFLLFMIIISNNVAIDVRALGENEGLVPLVKSSERKSILSTENGEISSVRVTDGTTGSYHLQFITLEPNSLFLPVALHSDMLFYVHTGSGKLGWMDENEQKTVDLHIGDVFRLVYGSIFFLESNLEPTRQKLRVYSIFANSEEDLREPPNEPYSSIRNMILGFDKKVLQEAFHVPEDVIKEVLAGTEVPAIVHGAPKSTEKHNNLWEMEAQFMRTVLGRDSYSFFDNKGKKKKEKDKKKKKGSKLFNVFQEKPDFKNCNGWSTVIDSKKMHALTGSQIGVYVVNLTKGSMMGPHWNPMATEIGIVIQGEGMVRVVCSNTGTGQGCKNMRFKVEEGDVFVVPRFHPMAQMSFINNSFVFVGFSTTTKKHHPQYLAGKASVLRTLDRHILEASFNVTNTTMDQIVEAQNDSVILECTSCAEEEKRLMEEEVKREEEETRRKEEEEAKKKEEEEREKEEEEAREAEEERKEKEAEEARKREEEAAKEKEEERKRQEEAARKREEEEAARQEEEIRRRQEEEEAKRREEEEERERQEAEEARKRQEEEEAARRQQEEEAKRQEEEIRKRQEEEEAKKREEERERQEAEEARKRQEEKEEEEARRREEEEAARRQQEEEAQREAEEASREEEEAEKRRQEEEARRSEEEKQREPEEEAQREAEESRRREEEEAAKREQEEETEGEARKKAEEAQREAEEARRRQEEAETRRKQEEEEARRSEEEEAKESEKRGQEETERQEEEARRQEEETEKRHQEEETEKEEPGGYEHIFLKSSMINGVHT